MENLKDLGIVNLNNNEAQTIDGGIILGNYGNYFIDCFQWAYTEFKKGVDDGLNGK